MWLTTAVAVVTAIVTTTDGRHLYFLVMIAVNRQLVPAAATGPIRIDKPYTWH